MVTTTRSSAPTTPWTTRVRQEMNALPRESRDTLFLLLVVGWVMGAYTWASASTFNFFPKASILILDSAQKQKLVAVA